MYDIHEADSKKQEQEQMNMLAKKYEELCGSSSFTGVTVGPVQSDKFKKDLLEFMEYTRMAIGMTQIEFAKILGISPENYNRWAVGKVLPGRYSIFKICNTLGKIYHSKMKCPSAEPWVMHTHREKPETENYSGSTETKRTPLESSGRQG